MNSSSCHSVAVVIPCFRVSSQILSVIKGIGEEVSRIYVIDDHCPEKSGELVEQNCRDSRVCVVRHTVNKGVGGAVMTGYELAVADGYDVIVKLDGDAQMDPGYIPILVEPIVLKKADYTKGNRFYAPNLIKGMPAVRILGNGLLSFVNKATSGYWNLMDPTNGFTAIHASLITHLPLKDIDRRYFFESDMLFRLAVLRAKVVDVPIPAHYGGETSGLSITSVMLQFPFKYTKCFFKRLAYSYFIRDFNACSLELVVGFVLVLVGGFFGAHEWYNNGAYGVFTSSGNVMLAALPIILGFQLLLSALHLDITNVPQSPIFPSLNQHRRGSLPKL